MYLDLFTNRELVLTILATTIIFGGSARKKSKKGEPQKVEQKNKIQ